MSGSKFSTESARRPKRQQKTHAIDAINTGTCGWSICGTYTFNLVRDHAEVTCLNCKKRLARKP